MSKNRTKFIIEKHSRLNKSFKILPPSDWDIEIFIDFDDVDHVTVNKEARAIVKILNNNLKELKINTKGAK